MTGAGNPVSPGEARTLDGLMAERVARTPAAPAYREFDAASGQWRSLNWAETDALIARWQAALQGEGMARGDRVALMIANSIAWVAFEQAALGLGLVVVPIYARDRAGNAAYVLENSGARLLLVAEPSVWSEILAEDARLAAISRVVSLAPVAAGGDARLVHVGAWLPDQGGALARSSDGGALATLVYTSGTSGPPKGICLSHANILANAAAGIASVPVYGDDVFLSFLPLNHMLERTVGYYVPMMAGAETAFVRSIPDLPEDLRTVRPTCIVSVPRIYERVHERIGEALAAKGWIARALFRTAATAGWRAFEHARGRARWSPILLVAPLGRRLVAGPVLAAFGGRLRSAISGGAALPGAVARDLIALGVPIYQGYGLTEAGPVISVNTVANNDPASVGPPLAGVEVRIGEADEIQVRGPSVMMGYWNNDAATRDAMTADGWLRTGDTGRMEGGRLYISGRIKDIIVLDTGEKVAPVDMEHDIAQDPMIDQVLVIGEGRPFLAALVVPAAGWKDGDASKMLARIEARTRHFPGYARIRRVLIADQPWTLENDLMTATLKIKRQKVLDLYAGKIEEVYASARADEAGS